MAYRIMRYMTRPTARAADRARAEAGIPDLHEKPKWATIPANLRLPVIFEHPLYSLHAMRCLVLRPDTGNAWWMDVPFEKWKRIPKMEVDQNAYRL
jgi:hypothetical protein